MKLTAEFMSERREERIAVISTAEFTFENGLVHFEYKHARDKRSCRHGRLFESRHTTWSLRERESGRTLVRSRSLLVEFFVFRNDAYLHPHTKHP